MNLETIKNLILLFCLAITFYNCQSQQEQLRATIDLSGEWQLALDTANIGVQQDWFAKDLSDNIKLPGTTDSNQKGFLNKDTIRKHIARVYKYSDPAWYRKKIVIPSEYADKHITFKMERTKSAMVWVDGNYVGESMLLQSLQSYNISEYLTLGEHTITVRANNDRILTPYGEVRIYTDETQTNWNGIIGSIVLEASPKTYFEYLQIYPDIENKKTLVKLAVDNGLNLDEVNIQLNVTRVLNRNKKDLNSVKVDDGKFLVCM